MSEKPPDPPVPEQVSPMDTLPPELLDKVLGNLWVVDRVRASLVSRKFNQSMQRVHRFPKVIHCVELGSHELILKSQSGEAIFFGCTRSPDRWPYGRRQLSKRDDVRLQGGNYGWRAFVTEDVFRLAVADFLKRLKWAEIVILRADVEFNHYVYLQSAIESRFLVITEPIVDIGRSPTAIRSILDNSNARSICFKQNHYREHHMEKCDVDVMLHRTVFGADEEIYILFRTTPESQRRLHELNARLFAAFLKWKSDIYSFIRRWYSGKGSLIEGVWVCEENISHCFEDLGELNPVLRGEDETSTDGSGVKYQFRIKRLDDHVALVGHTNNHDLHFLDVTEQKARSLERKLGGDKWNRLFRGTLNVEEMV